MVGDVQSFREFVVHDDAMAGDALHDALAQLSDDDYALVQSIFVLGMTEREIAEQLGVSQNVINRKKARIVNFLKTILEK